ncbi:hypothetical protein GGR54DRAFT_637532 [Hypoxylon sp. NC1633]|nr:hypothetical protein GGR54DRAFT_637532 [Hypoxylon sp. NC1633]
MDKEGNPQDGLKSDIATAIRECLGSCPASNIFTIIPRHTKEWEEAQWRMKVPVVYADFSKTEQSDILGSVIEAVEKVVEKYIRIYDEGSDLYPAGSGIDPRLYLIIVKPFNITIGPKMARAILPPSRPAESKSQIGWSGRQRVITKKVLNLKGHKER